MRQLTDEETRLVLEKLTKFLGDNVMLLVDRKDQPHVFRLHRDRIFYLSETVLKMAGCIPRKSLLCAGVCMGKLTKTRKFNLSITALHYLSRYAIYKIWLKPAGEQTFVYGNHIIKRHIGRITESTPCNTGVVVYSMNDIPLGFGVTAKTTEHMRAAPTEALVVYHQADVGEYLREEADLV
eukprot:GHVQ01027499.1.p1 GENE.GHVQ01027499.1~~GHVQ01027499.1.p1  ORF type:complete len:181 (+),score=20.29 GHVQ01027499.1:478-1020(+)